MSFLGPEFGAQFALFVIHPVHHYLDQCVVYKKVHFPKHMVHYHLEFRCTIIFICYNYSIHQFNPNQPPELLGSILFYL